MADRLTIYVPTEGADDGDVVQLYGPDSAGAVDWNAPVPGARAVVRRGAVGRGGNAPAGLGAAGLQTRWMELRGPELVFGSKQFGVKRFDRDKRQASEDTPDTITSFVNASPLPSSELTAVAEPVAGKLKFTFTKGIFV